MPNHIHVLFRTLEGYALVAQLKSWKGFTSREINKVLGESGKLWEGDYWDRLIGNAQNFINKVELYPEQSKLKSGKFKMAHSNPPKLKK